MLEANEGLENIFENAVKEAEKRRHEYVTIEHVLLALIKDEGIGTVLHDFKINVGMLIKDVEDYLDTKASCQAEGFSFVPMLVEATGGGWGSQALRVWSFLANSTATATGEDRASAKLHLMQNLSLVLHRENARALVRRSPAPTHGLPPP